MPVMANTSPTLDAGAALRIRIEAAPLVSHAFEASPLCEIPLMVSVENCDRTATVEFALDLMPSPSVAPSSSPQSMSQADLSSSLRDSVQPIASGDAFWLGRTHLEEQWVGPSSAVEFPLRLVVTAPGIFSLDGVRLTATAWKHGHGAKDVYRPEGPIICPPPPARTVQVVATAC